MTKKFWERVFFMAKWSTEHESGKIFALRLRIRSAFFKNSKWRPKATNFADFQVITGLLLYLEWIYWLFYGCKLWWRGWKVNVINFAMVYSHPGSKNSKWPPNSGPKSVFELENVNTQRNLAFNISFPRFLRSRNRNMPK